MDGSGTLNQIASSTKKGKLTNKPEKVSINLNQGDRILVQIHGYQREIGTYLLLIDPL